MAGNAFIQGSVVVAAAGTAVPLSGTAALPAPLLVRSLAITAKKVAGSNTGIVYIGDSTVDSTSNQGHPMAAGDEWDYPLTEGTELDLNTVYVDAATNADGVVFTYIRA